MYSLPSQEWPVHSEMRQKRQRRRGRWSSCTTEYGVPFGGGGLLQATQLKSIYWFGDIAWASQGVQVTQMTRLQQTDRVPKPWATTTMALLMKPAICKPRIAHYEPWLPCEEDLTDTGRIPSEIERFHWFRGFPACLPHLVQLATST